jgi:hypothetical protein
MNDDDLFSKAVNGTKAVLHPEFEQIGAIGGWRPAKAARRCDCAGAYHCVGDKAIGIDKCGRGGIGRPPKPQSLTWIDIGGAQVKTKRTRRGQIDVVADSRSATREVGDRCECGILVVATVEDHDLNVALCIADDVAIAVLGDIHTQDTDLDIAGIGVEMQDARLGIERHVPAGPKWS